MLLIFLGKKLYVIDLIYLDMDGVIADFDKAYQSQYGVYCRDDPKRDHWEEAVNNGIFANLEYTPGAIELIKFVEKLNVRIEILSCIGNRGNQCQVARQKKEWLIAKGFYYRTNFTFTKREKSDYASPNSLLIDDSSGCIDPFREQGGHGILYENTKSAIEQLSCMIKRGLLCAQSPDLEISKR